ncbi:MAG: type 1 glutamine amidotransferase [Jiangellales bacterium]
MTVVVLQHVAVEGPGRIAAALDRAGHTWRTVRLFEGVAAPVGPSGIDGLVVMGGPMSVTDTDAYPHLMAEQNLIADCLDAHVPVLGVCLGSQLLAATLGADVRPGPRIELGWHEVTLTELGHTDPVLGRLPSPFAPLHWHGDVYELPAGAVHLASSVLTPVQAFRFEHSAYGLLFHLEAGHDQVTAMATQFPDDLAAAGGEARGLLDPQHSARLAQAADGALDAWVALLA